MEEEGDESLPNYFIDGRQLAVKAPSVVDNGLFACAADNAAGLTHISLVHILPPPHLGPRALSKKGTIVGLPALRQGCEPAAAVGGAAGPRTHQAGRRRQAHLPLGRGRQRRLVPTRTRRPPFAQFGSPRWAMLGGGEGRGVVLKRALKWRAAC